MTASKLEKILCIEDQLDIQAVVKVALESVGKLTVKTCDSGQQALREVLEFEPDLILLDVMMPGLDGPSTLSALRKIPETVETPVIFMTAKVMDSEVQSYKEMGAIGVIAKPFDPINLASQVRAIWEQRND